MSKTIIRYNILKDNSYELPIITITPVSDIEVKLSFPSIPKSIIISTNQTVTIKQQMVLNSLTCNLYGNDTLLYSKDNFFDNGTIIVTGQCTVEEEFEPIIV